MNKILITFYVLYLETEYDLLIPINMPVKEVINLVQQSVSELSEGVYKINSEALLYSENGTIINYNNIVKFSGLRNGSKVILV